MTSYLRYKAEMAVLDKDEEIESWITVHGNHIPIKKGQSKEDAVEEFLFKRKEEAGYNVNTVKYEQKEKAEKAGFSMSSMAEKKKKVAEATHEYNNANGEYEQYAQWNKEKKEKMNYSVMSAPSLKGFVINKNDKGVIARGNGKPLVFEDIDRARDYIKTLKKEESKYDPDFEVVRKNALANGNVYGGKYTQKSKAEAYKEYKNDISSKENMKKANEFVNGSEKPKVTHVDKKAWNSPATDPWKSLYDKADK